MSDKTKVSLIFFMPIVIFIILAIFLSSKFFIAITMVWIVLAGNVYSEILSEVEFQESLKQGKTRIISHAEYNRSFGIKNKLEVVKDEIPK